MLTDSEKAGIEHEAARYADRRAVCIDALKIVQQHRGFVTDEAVADLSSYLGMSRAELDSIATFYNLVFRRPVGRHVILLCDSVSCWITGYEKVREALCARLGIGGFGETTDDGRFTLLPIPCLGACDHAPAMLIDGELHGDLAPDRLESLLARYP